MADLITRTDTLNQGREKLNTAITDAETAKIVSEQADDKATQALAKSESTQTQLDTIVIDGDSSVEAAQARVSTTGTAYGTLKQRLDTEYEEVTSQLAQSVYENKNVQDETKRVIVSFSTDDGALADWDKLRHLSEEYGIPFTAAIIAGDSHGINQDDEKLSYLQNELGW